MNRDAKPAPASPRPSCWGLGFDWDSRQQVSITTCQQCPHDTGCSLMRQARGTETLTTVVESIADVRLMGGKASRDFWRYR